MCGFVYVNKGVTGGLKAAVSDLLELELQVVMSHLTQVLGPEMDSSGRTNSVHSTHESCLWHHFKFIFFFYFKRSYYCNL